MPIPSPNDGEKEEDFISRCMGNDTMVSDYPDNDQRSAVCYSAWGENRSAPLGVRRAILRASMQIDEADDRAVTVTCSTEMMGRDKIVLMTRGANLDNYRANPIWLWQHNPDWPIARSETIDNGSDKLVSRVRFPPAGVSARADEVLGLIRAGVISAASTGFDVIAQELIDRNKPSDGTRITKWELQEMSFVSIPAVPDALVTQRSAAEIERMVEEAVERRTVKITLDNGAGNTDRRASVISALKTRGLYECGSLAMTLENLGWLKSSVEWEAGVEQDGSDVPRQLGEAMKALGDVLINMTAEEVAEMVGGGEAVDDIVEPAEVEIVTQARTPAMARFLIGLHRARARNTQPAKLTSSAGRRRFFQALATRLERELTAA
jgi:HK97 family phage prohead protease